ncbi:MAG: hypothetical protein Q9181_006739 [Wetmoreana brouardii]
MFARGTPLKKNTTKWQQEAKIVTQYSWPLILTYLLQYSLLATNVFTIAPIGHLGKIELGAVSLGTMTANITGHAVYMGLASSLDTLCAQAYGSGQKKLVGIHLQKMVYLLWSVTLPIGVIWFNSDHILGAIVPDKDTTRLAGLYLKILLIGAPGWCAFESGKRFVQPQGLFRANLYVLLSIAPFNVFLHWPCVWHLGWGFVGAPIAVAISHCSLPLDLIFYVRFVDGRQCWGGFSRASFSDWGPMISLAPPGFLMLEAEWMAFEILTLNASWLTPTHLAAQSILMTLATLGSQVPLPFGIAVSTRIANFEASLAPAARKSAKVGLIGAILLGTFNTCILSSLMNTTPRLFTHDEEVIALVAETLPLCAAFQLVDALGNTCNGIIRGIGRQKVDGYVAICCFYLVRSSIPPKILGQVLNPPRLVSPYLSGPVSHCTGISLGFGPARQ